MDEMEERDGWKEEDIPPVSKSWICSGFNIGCWV
jgi:hypothetical protein